MVEPNQNSIVNRSSVDQFRFFFDEVPSAQFFKEEKYPGDIDTIHNMPSVTAKSVNLPEVTCDEQRRKTPHGEVTDFSNIVVYNDLSLTCIIDENLIIYNMILLWALMKSFPGKFGGLISEFKRKEDIFTDAHLEVIDNHGEVATTYTFYDVHPLTIPDMDLDYSSDENMTIDFDFAYSYYLPDNIKSMHT